jgi:hypothetical protein
LIISYVPVTSVTGHIRSSWPFFFEVHSRLKMGAEQIICTNAIVARRVGLLHNLKRALLLEESTIVKKIRRFEDYSKTSRLPRGAVMQPHGRPSGGKVGCGRCTDYGE